MNDDDKEVVVERGVVFISGVRSGKVFMLSESIARITEALKQLDCYQELQEKIAIVMDGCMDELKEALQKLAGAFGSNVPNLQELMNELQGECEESTNEKDDKLSWRNKKRNSNVSKQHINASAKHSAINRRAVIRCRNNCH